MMSRSDTDDAAPVAVSPPLISALFDFEAAPGRYPLALREPRILFDNSRAVLVAAARRGMDGLPRPEAERVQSAAVFFVRTAMFRAAADHYTLLGVQPGCTNKQLSDHYRLLMRLIHPDFASAGNVWPREAAARINQAHDVLASPTRRSEYDQSLSHGLRSQFAVNSHAAVLPISARAEKRVPPKWRLAVAGAVGVVAFSLLVLQMPMGASADGDSPLSLVVPSVPLVAKSSTALATVVVPGSMPMKFETLLSTILPAVKKPVPVQPSLPATAGLDARAVKSFKPERAVPILVTSAEPRSTSTTNAVHAGYLVQPVQAVTVVPQLPPSALSLAPAATAPVLPAQAPVAVASVQPASQKADNQPPGAPSLADAQLLMSQLIQAMQSGRGEDLLSGMDRSLRQSSGAAELVLAYNHLIGGSRAIRLGAVQLRGRPQADRLVIDGVVPLVLQDQGQPAPVRELRLRALFVQRGGQVVMTELSTGGSRP